MAFQTTKGYTIRQLSFDEVKNLEKGDKVVICICFEPPRKMILEDATVVRPMFWNSDADEPDWGVETTNGFFGPHSFYEVFK